MTPKASFVIPVYNCQAWVSEAITSCREQSVKQIEIVVVNDGSKDHTKEIVEAMAKEDERIVLVDLERNVGRSEARNIGNEKAKAPYILVLDSDDKAARNRVKDTLACFQLKKSDLVYGGFITIDSLSNMERRFTPEPFNREASIKYRTHGICHSSLAYRKGVTFNVRYTKEPYDKLGIDDWKFIWDCHLKGYKFAYLKNPLCYYRMLEGSITHTRDTSEVAKVKEEFLAHAL